MPGRTLDDHIELTPSEHGVRPRADIDRNIKEDRAFAEIVRQQTPSKLTKRLRELRGND
jgi:hypothetical protein